MMNKNLTYLDFAVDELLYLTYAHKAGLRYNAMVAQAQRICECYMKNVLSTRLLSNNEQVMRTHNIRSLYEYMENCGLDVRPIRAEVMMLNNFYTHTRYPGKDSFMASPEDIDSAVEAIGKIASYMARFN